MKHLIISRIDLKDVELNYCDLSNALATLEWNSLDQAPWKDSYPYTPQAQFQIAYDDQAIYLHYDIQEQFVKAKYIRPNENVWEDSCVEFFISFDNRKTYYNAEFNVLGTGLIGYGSADKSQRKRLSSEEILKVDSFSQVRTLNGQKSWQQILVIPFEIYGQKGIDLSGVIAQANFYKCGDELPDPHFIAWNNIDYPSPNFHLPEFFGEIKFQ